jgi:hypothetical protein
MAIFMPSLEIMQLGTENYLKILSTYEFEYNSNNLEKLLAHNPCVVSK